MQRPTGVLLIAILYFLAAAFLVLIGVGLIAGVSLISALSPEPRVAAVLAGVGAFGGVFLLVLAAILGLIAWGLLARKNWARVVTIVFAALGIVGSLGGLLAMPSMRTGGTIAVAVIRLVINATIIWYLTRPQIKRAFALP